MGSLSAGTVPNTRSRDRSFSAYGNRGLQNAFLLDGARNQNYLRGLDNRARDAMRPSLEAIAEFKVQTSNYSAEYGASAGAVVNVVTKSGTNELHGSAFEFLRNSAMDARDYFLPAGSIKPLYVQHQFGGSLGGRIVKNRAWWHLAYQRTHISQGSTTSGVVPLPQERNGVFALPLFDPLTTRANPDGAGSIRDTFPNNAIPASRFDPIGKSLVDRYPNPNQAGAVQLQQQPAGFHAQPQRHRARRHTALRQGLAVRALVARPGRFRRPAAAAHRGADGRGAQRSGAQLRRRPHARAEPHHGERTPLRVQLRGVDAEPHAAPGRDRRRLPGPGHRRHSLVQRERLCGHRGAARQLRQRARTQGFLGLQLLRQLLHRARQADHQGWASISSTSTFPPSPPWTAAASFGFTGVFTQNPQRRPGSGSPVADFLLGLPNNITVGSPSDAHERARNYYAYVQDDWNITPVLHPQLRRAV